MTMRTIDRFGVLGNAYLGQVKNCRIFQPSTSSPGPFSEPPSPAPVAPQTPAKGVSLTADIQNETGETPRGIILYPGDEPVFLIATAFGVLSGAPPSDPSQVESYSLPMQMTAADPAVIRSSIAKPLSGYSKKVWFFKIDKSPITFSIAPDEMTDLDGTRLSSIVFKFAPVGSFVVTPPSAVLADGDNQTMSFTVTTKGSMGSRKSYPLFNLRRGW